MNIRHTLFAMPVAFAAGFSFAPAAPAHAQAQQKDPFVAACMARKNTVERKCVCQAKIARANLDRRELQAALLALRGDNDAFTKTVRGFGEAKAKGFSAKMQKFGAQAREKCN